MRKRIAAVLCLLMVAVVPAVPAQSTENEWIRSQREQMESMATRVDYFVQQARRISEAANQATQANRSGGGEALANIIQTSQSMMNIAMEIKISLQRSQDLLENETLMKDEQIKRDILAARTQLSDMAGGLGNTLQYMEHMVYRINQSAAEQ